MGKSYDSSLKMKLKKYIYILYCQACIIIVLFTEKLEQVTEQLFFISLCNLKIGISFLNACCCRSDEISNSPWLHTVLNK